MNNDNRHIELNVLTCIIVAGFAVHRILYRKAPVHDPVIVHTPIQAKSSRAGLPFRAVYLLPVPLAGAAIWHDRWTVTALLVAGWLPLAFAASLALAGGVAVGRKANRTDAGVVAGLAIGLLVSITGISFTQIASVDGCIGKQWQGHQDEPQRHKENGVAQSRPGLDAARLNDGKTHEKRTKAHQESKIPPYGCSVLAETPDRMVAVVTMRLTLFAVLGTFVFGAVAVFALLIQAVPKNREWD